MKTLQILLVCVYVVLIQPKWTSPHFVSLQAQAVSTPQLSEDTDKEVFSRLTNELTSLRTQIEGLSNSADRLQHLNAKGQLEFKQLVDRSLRNAIALNTLRESTSKKIPQAYLADIADDADVIEQVRQAKEIKRRELDKVRAVNDDLQPKREQAEKRTEAPFDLVTVTIVTKKNHIPTGGYEVWFVKVLLEDDESKYDTFNKYSDDKCGDSDDKCGKTSRDLPPSNYKMWTKTTDGRKVLGDREKKVVGDGSPTVEFDLTAKD